VTIAMNKTGHWTGLRRGRGPREVRQNGREWLYVLMGRPASARGAASALIMPELNTGVLNLFLEQFLRGVADGGCMRC